MQLKMLFSQINIGKLTLKNRIVMPSMGTLYTSDSTMTPRMSEFYLTRAKGGAGLIIVGPVGVDKVGGGPLLLGLDEDRFIAPMKGFMNKIHGETDAKAAPQLFHAGRYAFSIMTGEQPVAPSAIPSKLTHEMPRELSVAEIKNIINKYKEAAIRAREADFDAIEILACTGYLITEFLSLITNKREDEYGGSWENRIRFPLEIIKSIKQGVGEDFPLIVRVAGNDFMKGGLNNTDAKRFCEDLEGAGVHAINVTGGWHETNVPQITYDVPDGGFAYLAKGIKEGVNIPVFASNLLGDPIKAERILRHDMADLVCMGRPLLADPELPIKAQNNRLAEITPCISCNQACFDNIFMGHPVCCMVNPRVGLEMEYNEKPAENPKNILIIGGGPAGLKAAITAAKRGHKVKLYEAGQELGGQVRLGAKKLGKNNFSRLINIYAEQARQAGVKFILNLKADADTILQESPDTVIIATGGKPAPINVKGSDLPHVVSAWDVLDEKVVIKGRDVVVIGGSATGCETAELIASYGTITPDVTDFLMHYRAETPEAIREFMFKGTKKVTIIEMLDKIALNVGKTSRWALIRNLKSYGVKQLTNTRLTEIRKDKIVVMKNEEELIIPADTVVIAAGVLPVNDLYEQLKGKIDQLHIIGDAIQPRRMVEAIREGYELGLKI